jgi:hypothetical protein
VARAGIFVVTFASLVGRGGSGNRIFLAEQRSVDRFRPLERTFQRASVLISSHPEIGKVMNKLSEDAIAVVRVGTSVQNVLVPKEVDVACGNH